MKIEDLIKFKGEQYGDPEEFFEQLAKLWSAMLDEKLTAEQCVALMIAFRNLRYIKNPNHSDTLQDIEGYTYIAKVLSNLDCESEN